MRFFFIIFVFSLVALNGVSIEKADVFLTVNPEDGLIEVVTSLELKPLPDVEEIDLILNRSLAITEISSSVPIDGFHHEKSQEPGPYQYAPQATSLTIYLNEMSNGKTIYLEICAEGRVEPDAWGVTQVKSEWVELEAVYSAWFPFSPKDGTYHLNLEVHVPTDWIVAGTGRPTLEDSVWISAKKEVEDVVVLASPEMKRIPVGEDLILWHVDLPAEVPDYIIRDASKVKNILSGWFGSISDGQVDLVFPPRESGGGFARPGLVLMIYDPSFYNQGKITPVFLRYLAHEVSHLWWYQASATNWQDWLNESFAEFTALLILREYFGEELFSKKIQSYRKAAEGTPPIKNLSRRDKSAYKVLYQKGPVILADLEASIGRKAFARFLRTLAERKINNTDKCLNVLEEVVSKEARKNLQTALSEY